MYACRTFTNIVELTDFLNGAVVGSPLGARLFGLNGLTLVINDGSADRTVTFADADQTGLTPLNMLTQIRATHANLANVVLRNYGHNIKEPALALPKIGYSIKAGTANAAVGWPATTTLIAEVPKANIVTLSAAYDVGPRYEVVINS